MSENISKNTKAKTIGRVFLAVLKTEFFGFIELLFLIALTTPLGKGANVFMGIIGILTVFCLMTDFGMTEGNKAHKRVKLHGESISKNYGYVLGAISMIPSYVTLLILILSKTGVIGNFYPAYKMLNACFAPIFALISDSAKAADVSAIVFIVGAVCPLFYMLSTQIGYKIGFEQIDLKEKFMYKKGE